MEEKNQQHNQINPKHVMNSLGNRIADLNIELASKDAVIIQQKQQIEDLEKDNKELRKQLAEEVKKAE